MPTVELTPRLARQSKPQAKDTILFDKFLSGFGLRILGSLRLHDLRHTAASQAIMSGENLPLVGKLLRHRRHRTTAGYAHLADDHLVEAAEKVGRLIKEQMAMSQGWQSSGQRPSGFGRLISI